MKSKVLQSAIAKTVGAGRNKGCLNQFRERSRLTDTYEISAKTSYERYSKTKLPFLTYGGWHYYEWPLGCH
jgi:hypothetical protein